ncbi:MAG: hypothetical protein L0206_14095, partial [Actinobacteria bacterium]|nr:hypothetical protein [Actinomycetota bacterium]
FDARGRSVDAPVAWVDGAIEIHVPAAFIARAVFPITIDPLVTTLSIDASPAQDSLPDVAYDASLDVYAVCWERTFSQTDRDVHGAILDAAGNSVAEFLIDATPSILRMPRIAGIDALDRFLIAVIRGGGEGPLEVRVLDLAGGSPSVGPPVTPFPITWTYGYVDVAGDSGTAPPFHVCLVGQDEYFGALIVDVMILSHDGLPGPYFYFGLDDDYSAWEPRISRTLAGRDDGQRGWSLLIRSGSIYDPGTPSLRRVFPNGTWGENGIIPPPFGHARGAYQVLDAATGEPIIVVIWEAAGRISAKARRGTSWGPETIVAPDGTSQEAAIDGDGSSVVVTYTQPPEGGGPPATYAASYVLEDLTLVLTERTQLSASTAASSAPRAISTRSGGGAPGRFAAV